MSKTLRIGVAGLGFMGATHIKAITQLEGVEIGALLNPSGHRLDGDFSDVSGNLGDGSPLRLDMENITAYKEAEAFLADPTIDIIDICTPTPSHKNLTEAALRAGKHVLCEKPMARNSGEARSMAAVSAETGKLLMPAMCLRFIPEWKIIRDCVRDQRYGKVLAARFRRVGEPPTWNPSFFFDKEKSGGAILDLHIHDADFVQFCFGKPRRVHAQGFSKVSGGIDHVNALYDFEDGPSVEAEGSWAMSPGFGFNMSYTVIFKNATLDYDMSRGEEAFRCHKADEAVPDPEPEETDGYRGEIRHLADAIRNGTPLSEVTVQDAIDSIELIEAEEQSIESGVPIDLKP